MNIDRLTQILDCFSRHSVLVIGDFFLDKYVYIDKSLDRRSLETGRKAHQVINVKNSPGAAGNVVKNLVAIGAGTVHCLGVIGDDGNGDDLLRVLGRIECNVDFLLRENAVMTPTYQKLYDVDVAGLDGEIDRLDFINQNSLSPTMISMVLFKRHLRPEW